MILKRSVVPHGVPQNQNFRDDTERIIRLAIFRVQEYARNRRVPKAVVISYPLADVHYLLTSELMKRGHSYVKGPPGKWTLTFGLCFALGELGISA